MRDRLMNFCLLGTSLIRTVGLRQLGLSLTGEAVALGSSLICAVGLRQLTLELCPLCAVFDLDLP